MIPAARDPDPEGEVRGSPSALTVRGNRYQRAIRVIGQQADFGRRPASVRSFFRHTCVTAE